MRKCFLLSKHGYSKVRKSLTRITRKGERREFFRGFAKIRSLRAFRVKPVPKIEKSPSDFGIIMTVKKNANLGARPALIRFILGT